jgi:NADH-quinone oxidoreductase subunit M
MNLSANLLTVITFLPTVGALILLFLPGRDEASANAVRWVSLLVTLVTFALSLWLWAAFDASNPGFQFVENFDWIGNSIGYRMGVDGISILFVPLTALLMALVVISSWGSVQARVREYHIVFLILETLMIGAFVTLDLAMFYVFWGGARRIQATYKFFFYSFTGTVLMLIAIMAMFAEAGTVDIRQLLQFRFAPEVQFWLWLAFFASFAVKLPMWPFHRWLPEAHVEAPTAGSVLLAAILLKLGGYGFIRFSLAMFPEASQYFSGFVFVLSIAAIVITSLVALVQTDMKKLIAYSSVAHMGFVTMGIFAANEFGVQGAIFQMVSHGLVSGALFLCVGVVYDRMHTREIAAYGGLVERMPQYAFAFMVFTMANVGLPGTSGFVGEFLTLLAVFQVNTWVAFVAASGVILSASYALYLYRRMIFGALTKDSLKGILDLDRRELVVLVPLLVLTILFGFYPAPILDTSAAAVHALIDNLPAFTDAAATAVTEAVTAPAAH